MIFDLYRRIPKSSQPIGSNFEDLDLGFLDQTDRIPSKESARKRQVPRKDSAQPIGSKNQPSSPTKNLAQGEKKPSSKHRKQKETPSSQATKSQKESKHSKPPAFAKSTEGTNEREQPLSDQHLELVEPSRDQSQKQEAVFFAALFLGAATGLSQALMVYVNTFFWQLSTTQIGYLPLLGIIAVPASFIVAPQLAERFGKKQAAIGLFIFAVAFLPVPYVCALLGWFPVPGSSAYVPLIMLCYLIETSAFISMQIVFGSMNADLVEDRGVNFAGQRDEGLIFAARNFCKKVVSGSGILLAGGVLWLAGFPENAVMGAVDQSVLHKLIFLFLPAVMTLYLLSCWCMSGYAIDRQQHQQNLHNLAS